jgi:hypothetical protein
MNPSPNRSSKSPKSTSNRKAQPSEPAVNLPKDTDSIPETPDESPVPSALATPVDQNQPPTPTDAPASKLATPVDQNQPPTPTDAPASKDRLQRPRYSSSSALDKDKTKPPDQPSNAPPPSEQAAPSEAVSAPTPLAVAPPANAEPAANKSGR